MKKIIFKSVSIVVIMAHLSLVCMRDVAFAQSSSGDSSAGSSQNNGNSAQAESAKTQTASTVQAMSTSDNPTNPSFSFQLVDNGNFNNILKSVTADTFTGKLQFNIPILMPFGKRDITLSLNISYDSSSGEGILGMGWALNLGLISRSTKRGMPSYSSSDVFLAQGDELTNIGGNSFRNKVEDSFMNYTFDGTAWLAIDKSGKKYYFGSTDNSRVTNASGTFSWSLDRIEDPSGNYMSITYVKDQNTIYPSEIAYTGNNNTGLSPCFTVDFVFDTRPDNLVSYRSGYQTVMAKRLSEIDINCNQGLIRKYHFDYAASSATSQSLLSAVTLYGKDGTTLLPPVTFQYSAMNSGWTLSANQLPSDMTFDGATRVLDVNNDGIPDILKYEGTTTFRTFLGQKDGTFLETSDWKLPDNLIFGGSHTNVGCGGTQYWENNGVQIVDVNGDGWPDIITHQHRNETSEAIKKVYINNHVNGWVYDPSWTNALPESAYFVSFIVRIIGPIFCGSLGRNKGWVAIDVNGDGYADLIQALGGTYNCYINTGSGWTQDTSWNMPDGDISNGSTQFCDLNGDGLLDFFIVDGANSRAYLNTGHGWVRDHDYDIDLTGISAQSVQLMDINSDGLADIVIATGATETTYINTGKTGNVWQPNSGFALPDGDFTALTARLADTRGKALLDVLVNSSSENKIYLNNNAIVPNLLTEVTNGVDGEVDIAYKSSPQFDNTNGSGVSALPFPVYVVGTVTTKDNVSSNPNIVTTYNYKGGAFDFASREFRGFNDVKVSDGEGNYTETYYRQDDVYKGKILKQKISDSSGNLLAETDNTWQATQPYTGVTFPYLAQTDNYIYDYIDSQQVSKQTQIQYQYDDYGNVTNVYCLGDVSVNGDEKTQVVEYVYNTNNWIVSLPKHTYLLDSGGNKVSEKWFYYDNNTNITDPPVKGLLTKEESWLYNPITAATDKVSTQYAYNQYGSPISATDALGRMTTTNYDTVCYSYPVSVANALNQSVQTVYYGINEPANDPITGSGLIGQAKSVQDVNNQKTYNVYDALGRLINVIGPNDTVNNPGIIYEYHLDLSPVKIIKRVKTTYDNPPVYLSSFQFLDGLNRTIEIKSPAQDSSTGQARQIISGLVKYDARGQLKEKYLPYFVNASGDFDTPLYNTPHSSYAYDALGRLIQANNPDTSYSTMSYSLWKKTLTDENGHSKSEYRDAYGRITKVEEHNGTQTYTTNYQYDALGNLVQTTDNQNNVIQIQYDSLGRKIRMNDPDMGIWNYTYDNVGNLIQQTDAKGNALGFVYDSINRLQQKTGNGQTLTTYTYDSTSKQYCIGRISSISDLSGSTEFYYDNLGREIKSVKTIGGASYTVERTYDALDRLITLKYPDNSIIRYGYNPQGINKVTDTAASYDYISNIDYSPTGQITKIQYGNGTETDYTYNPNTLRLSNLTTQSPSGKIQDLTYQFDNAGNIMQLTDGVNTATQSFQYDDLNRLIQAAGSYGSFGYSYDSIGNMINKEGITLGYGSGGKFPHAVTQYGDTIITYDANGNMFTKGNLKLTYDAENRLIKTEPTGPQTTTITLTLNPGWNFFSFPIIPTDATVSSVLFSIAGEFSQVSRYNPATNKFENYIGNPTYDQFNTFEYGRGYEIFIPGTSTISLTITGTPPTGQSVSLKTGTNLVFNPGNTEIPVETALSPLKLGVDYSKVLSYDATQGVFQEYSAAKKEFTVLKPGIAYYLYCLFDCTWTPFSDITTFAYDGDGGRVEKITASGSATYIGSLFEVGSAGKTIKYIFAGSNRVATVESTGSTYYTHSDHLGSSNVITNRDGYIVQHCEYTPYGSLASNESTEYIVTAYGISVVTGNKDYIKHKFTGKEIDNTGLYFYGARYYDPQIGRFISADTIVQPPYDPQSLNRYSYCHNNPINYIDPTGHSWWKKIAGFFGAAVGVALGFINPFLGMMAYSLIAASGQGGNFGSNFGINFASSLAGFVVGAAAGGIASNFFAGNYWPSLIGSAIGGAAGGAATSAMLGGNVGMGALAGLAGGTISYAGGFVWPLGADAVAGGVSSVIMGGDFGEGAAQGAYYNMAETVGGILGPMPTLGEQNPQPGDTVFLKADSPVGWGISLFEGGPFSHVGTVTDQGLASTNFGKNSGFEDLGQYSNRGAYVSTRYRGNQSVINAAAALSNQSPKIKYGFFPGQKVCSTITASALNKGNGGWWGIGPNSELKVMKTYGEE
ncbi:MAG: RHS repeat-associated core domain-containing protein [Candidatus Omnitrophota bacterium]